MKLIIPLFLSLILISSCKEKAPPSLRGKWKVLLENDHKGSYKVYTYFDSTKMYGERIFMDSSYYHIHADTLFSTYYHDTTKIDTAFYKIVNKDTVLIKSLDGKNWYYMTREH
jgi:hypothetical protein